MGDLTVRRRGAVVAVWFVAGHQAGKLAVRAEGAYPGPLE
jgi:hypothetical protein